MPVETTEKMNIVCDNSKCPGNSGLDPSNRTGWLFVSSEFYGDETQQHVFCSGDCASVAAKDKNNSFATQPPKEEVAPPTEEEREA